MVLDAQGSLVGPDLLVLLWGRISPDLWETPAFLDWMESMDSKVLQVLPGLLVQAQPRETEVTLGSQASLAPLAGKETQASLEAPDFQAALVSKEDEVRLASVEVLVSRVSPVILVSMEAKDQRDFEGVLVVRVSPVSRCPWCHEITSDPTEKWVIPVQAEATVPLENLVSLEYLDVQVLKVVLVLWANLAGLDLLVCQDPSVMADPLVSLDLLENKVPLVQLDVPAPLAVSAAVTASDTRW